MRNEKEREGELPMKPSRGLQLKKKKQKKELYVCKTEMLPDSNSSHKHPSDQNTLLLIPRGELFKQV